MRDQALVAKLKAEQTAIQARVRLRVEVEAGRPIYEDDQRESFTDDDEDAAEFLAWAAQLPGWDEQPFVISDEAGGDR
jgi:hypothetical protein